jgi:hypothetical protein
MPRWKKCIEEQRTLPLQFGRRSVVPDHMISQGNFLPDRPLAGKHGFYHPPIESATGEALALNLGRRSHNDGGVKNRSRIRFKEKGYIGK